MPAADVLLFPQWKDEIYSLSTAVEDSAGNKIENSEGIHGSISCLVNGAEATTANAGAPVTVTATADSGYKVGRICYLVGNHEMARKVYNNGETTATYPFTMPAEDVSIRAMFVPIPYEDNANLDDTACEGLVSIGVEDGVYYADKKYAEGETIRIHAEDVIMTSTTGDPREGDPVPIGMV